MEISRSVQNQTIEKDKNFEKKCLRAKCNSPHFGILKQFFFLLLAWTWLGSEQQCIYRPDLHFSSFILKIEPLFSTVILRKIWERFPRRNAKKCALEKLAMIYTIK